MTVEYIRIQIQTRDIPDIESESSYYIRAGRLHVTRCLKYLNRPAETWCLNQIFAVE